MEGNEIIRDIRKIVRSINLESKRIQKDFGISIPQLLCLEHLTKSEGYQTTHRNLTRLLHLNSSTVTGIINRLEKKGLVARLPKKDDRRITNIALTSAGYALINQTPDLLHEKLNQRLQKLPSAKTEAIRDALKTLVEALDIADLDASPVITIEDPI